MTFFVYPHLYDPIKIADLNNCIFVFGDNLDKRGTGGSACIRHLPNAYGIPTKYHPKRWESAYFKDDLHMTCWHKYIKPCMDNLETLMVMQNINIAWPRDGIGTGLAKMDQYAPETLARINNKVESWKKVFNER